MVSDRSLIALGFAGLGIGLLGRKLMQIRSKNLFEKSITARTPDGVFCGVTDKHEDVWIKARQRTMHTQVIGTTNAGKTESVILPWAVQDMKLGRGLIIIDGKADNSLLEKLWGYAVKCGRSADFKLFSLGHIQQSHQFNPLLGGSAEEITERVFNSFEFENLYFKGLQFDVFSQVMRLMQETQTIPTFQRLYQLIKSPVLLEELSLKLQGEQHNPLRQWVLFYKSLTNNERELRTSGLLSSISSFAFGAHSELFNGGDSEDTITLDKALQHNHILYFQLPVMLTPFLGKATGKLVLQSLQAAVANRHRKENANREFFSVFLDDFSEYLYPGFVTILNKSRSANVGIVFAHQALGDIQALGEPIANAILTNSNIKVFMRGNDPASAEYFSKVIGTVTAVKFTERQKFNLLGSNKTGDVSARDAEEFIIHPNAFKRDLGVGEAMMVIPHEQGAKTLKIKFQKIDDLKREKFLEAKVKTTLPLFELKPMRIDAKAEKQHASSIDSLV